MSWTLNWALPSFGKKSCQRPKPPDIGDALLRFAAVVIKALGPINDMHTSLNMTLDYLDFDYSEDEHGHGSFDAMACTSAQRVAAVRAEIAHVLDWSHAAFPQMRAPLEEGGEWDYQLEGQREWSVLEAIDYDEASRQFSTRLGAPGEARHTVSVTFSGSAQFCAAFRRQFLPG
jgi:hypothetical protein